MTIDKSVRLPEIKEQNQALELPSKALTADKNNSLDEEAIACLGWSFLGGRRRAASAKQANCESKGFLTIPAQKQQAVAERNIPAAQNKVASNHTIEYLQTDKQRYKETHVGSKPEENYTAIVTKMADGITHIDYGKQGQRYIKSDGSQIEVTTDKNGNTVQKFIGGVSDKFSRTISPDGTIIDETIVDKDGSSQKHHLENGKLKQKEWFDKTGKSIATIRYEETKTIEKYAGGSSRIKHADGRVDEICLAANGSKIERHLDKNGQEIKSSVPAQKAVEQLKQLEAHGIDFFRQRLKNGVLSLTAADKIVDEDLQHLAALNKESPIKDLCLQDHKITDNGLIHLKGLSDLQSLALSNLEITDKGLVHLQDLKSLANLVLSKNNISGTGLKHLKSMKDLETLSLEGTSLTDEGMPHLTNLAKLQVLNLGSTGITDEGLLHLKTMTSLEQLILTNMQLSGAAKIELQVDRKKLIDILD